MTINCMDVEIRFGGRRESPVKTTKYDREL